MAQRLRVPLGFVIAAAVLYLARPTGPSIALGLPIAAAGALLRAMAAGTIRKDKSLATQGPYARTRNPLYLGSSLLAVGFGVMSWNPAAAALLLVPSLLIYPRVIQREEEHLERLFPAEFRAYKQKVPRFLPRLSNSRYSFSLDQYVANREYNTALGFCAVLVVFIVKWRLI
jgi:protein-S-isoprenylcysteine O-methyltransferase Ste14